jgi:hypothetical protein
MAIQTTVVTNPIGIAGQLAEGYPYRKRSLVNGETSAMAFGVGVTIGTGDREFKLPTQSTDKFVGITCHEYALDNQSLSGAAGIAADQVNSVLESGVIWILPEEDVTPASAVYWRYVVNAGDPLLTPGRFGDSTDSSKNVLMTNMRFLDTAAKDTPCRLQINQP